MRPTKDVLVVSLPFARILHVIGDEGVMNLEHIRRRLVLRLCNPQGLTRSSVWPKSPI